MRINSFRSGFLELFSGCVVHILYYDDLQSTPHSLTHSKCVQKSPKWNTECCNFGTLFPKPTPLSPHCVCCILQNQKPTMPKRNSNSLSSLFAFLNSLGKEALRPGSINHSVETALLFLCVFKTNNPYSLQFLGTPFLQNGQVLYCF